MKKIFLFCCFYLLLSRLFAQVCGTPGLDGPENISGSINTYFPPSGNVTLAAGAKSITLEAVPANDPYGNNFGTESIQAGDLLLLIQMQDATINYTNSNLYGAGNSASGTDALGATGYTSLGNSGRFEYVIATNAVALTGGTLTFKGAGTGGGTVYAYVNAAATATSGKKTFEVVRVPQYSNLVLSSDISTPPFNGKAGGIIAFDVSGSMDFNGHTIDASSKGFRGGYGIIAASGQNINNVFVTPSTDTRSVGKGEGIAGTPRYMWDGFNQVDNIDEGLPGGSYGRGAPANAGGGGDDHNAGGGGGGNGGPGGVGGDGVASLGTGFGSYPNGGRPGSVSYDGATPDITRIIMGGGGGGGDANDALTGVKGGVGGGIILINAETVTGTGTIRANGGNGAPGVSGINPDGAGGGGAGGTVFVKVSNPDPSAVLTIEANGGNGGNTVNDIRLNDEHGPGGGGGGGQIFYAVSAGTVNVISNAGKSGKSNSGFGIPHNASDGNGGNSKPYLLSDLPAYLQGGGSICYPALTTTMSEANTTANKFPGSEVVYTIKSTNANGGGNAGGVQIDLQVPAGLSFKSAAVAYTGNAGGPATITNTGTATRLLFGDFNISPGDAVIITLTMQVDCNTLPGKYNCSAQSIYLDPTRTIRDAKRRITGSVNAFTGTNTTYETGLTGSVPGSNYNGNLALSTTEDINVLPLVQLGNNSISIPVSQLAFCVSGDPSVISGSTPTGGAQVYTYQWQSSQDNINFIDITSATLNDFDPSTINATTYYKRVVSSLSCTPSIISNTIAIAIDHKPVVDFLTPDICLKDGSATFTNQTTIDNGTTLQYLWNFGEAGSALNTSTIKDASHAYKAAGNYIVSLTATSGTCAVTQTKPFTVNGSIPKADFTINSSSSFCSSQPIEFEDKAFVDFGEITKIEWYFDYSNNTSLVQTVDDPAKRSAPATIYPHSYPVFYSPETKDVSVRMVVYSGITCADEKTIPVTLKAVPEVAFNSIAPICNNIFSFQVTQASEIHGLLTGIGTYSGEGVNQQGVFSTSANDSGTHSLTYTFLADNGCSDSKTQTLTVYPSPTVKGASVELLQGGEIQLPVMITGSDLTYKWTPAVSLDHDDISNPIASPATDIIYTVLVTSPQGCSASGNVIVKVFQNPKIPNAFSPNKDGINDVWNIQNLNTYPDATVAIFNRYGQKIYYSVGYTNPWNGTYNGKDLPVGTYYYIIDTKKTVKPFSGSVTILR
ncbi:MAG TPA: gliding motility-associated C-terminal domain-containing protein [Panacibacter sp.]|nr:gliding motility-associated C-terminal domain-containing protein [Panacibacter sp.]